MRKLLVLILLIGLTPSAYAAKCEKKVCIKVYTDPATGRVVIEAKKGKPKVVVTYKPTPRIVTPRPTPTRTWKPRPYTPRPRVSKKPATSLADKLAQLIPNREINKLPVGDALVQVPVKFSTNTDLVFARAVSILGVAVQVNLTPTFNWDFGDGYTSVLIKPKHTFLKDSTFKVSLSIWNGAGCFDKHDTNLVINSSIHNIDQSAFVIYPNPFGNFVTIKMTESEPAVFVLEDVSGKEVIRRMLTQKETTLNLNEISRGIYITKIITNEGAFTGKLERIE